MEKNRTGICVLILCCLLLLGPLAAPSNAAETARRALTTAEQDEIIRQDFSSLQGEMATDVYILYGYIAGKNKRQARLISYAVAKRLAHHTMQDARFDEFLPGKSTLFLFVGLIQVESGFNPWAISNKNARGLMQVHIPTWKNYITVEQSHKIHDNITMGTSILYTYLSETRDLRKALYRYLGGRDNEYVRNVLTNALAFKRYYEHMAGTLTAQAEMPVIQKEG